MAETVIPWEIVPIPWTGHAPRFHKRYANGDTILATVEELQFWTVVETMRAEYVRMRAQIDQLEAENTELKGRIGQQAELNASDHPGASEADREAGRKLAEKKKK